MKKLFLLFFVIFIFPLSGFSQTKDFGIWYSATAALPLTRFMDIRFEGDIRTFEDASKINETFGEIGLSVKVIRFLSVGGAYRLTSQIENDNNYYLRHKFFLNLRGKTDVGRFGLSCRLMMERMDKTYIENLNDEQPVYHGRIRLETRYNIPKSKFEPDIYFETFSRLFESSPKTIEKFRFSAGVGYKISKKHKVNVFYIFQREYLPVLADINIISLSYDFKM